MNNMNTIDKAEIEKFSAYSFDWWNENGFFKPLHQMNPTRLKFIKNSIFKHFQRETLQGLSVIDVGCGGGLIAEPLRRMQATVTGIDASKENIIIAKEHALQMNLCIDYEVSTIEEIAQTKQKFDVICALEIVEHVNNLKFFLETCCQLLKPNGLMIVSTLNRTIKSYLLGIWLAERVLEWLPKGTHAWKKFVTPYEIYTILNSNNVHIVDIKGMKFNIMARKWIVSNDIKVNYILAASLKL